MIHTLAAPEPFQNLWFFVKPFGRDQYGYGLPDRLLRRVAEQSFRASVPAGDDAIKVLADNGIVAGIDNCAEQRRSQRGMLSLMLLLFGGVASLRRDQDDLALVI